MLRHLLLMLLLASSPTEAPSPDTAWVEQVDTRRGTDSTKDFSRGNTFVATCLPFGFNMWTPLTVPDSHRWLYAWRDPAMFGVGITHQASPWMGDYGALHFAPLLGEVKNSPQEQLEGYSHAHERARPYRYDVQLDNGVEINLAPTSHAAVLRLTFPPGQAAAVAVDDLAQSVGALRADLQRNAFAGWVQSSDHSGQNHTLHYYVEVAGMQLGEPQPLAGRSMGQRLPLIEVDGSRQATLRVATSWVSVAAAAASLQREVAGQSLEAVAAAGREIWQQQLGRIALEGATLAQTQTFYGSLYRTLLYPNSMAEGTDDASEYFSPYDRQVHRGRLSMNNGFWDTYRAVWPLHFLLRPAAAGAMVQGFLEGYRQSGWTPRWSAPGHAAMMVGTHLDVIVADALGKGVPGIDYQLGLEAALKNATVASHQALFGRPANHRAPYLGFVPGDLQQESAAWHIEDSLNDFGIAQLAGGLEHADLRDYFLRRAQNYRRLFDPRRRFFVGRAADGSFLRHGKTFSPKLWGYEYTEGNAWHYMAPAPFDLAGMARLYGGRKDLLQRLDALFAAPRGYQVGSYRKPIHEMDEAVAGGIGQYAHPNEPVHHIPWLYSALGKGASTQARVRQILAPASGLYGPGVDDGGGYLGDEDNGQLSAWYVFATLGFYPLQPGLATYVLGAPAVPQATVTLEGGKQLLIEARDLSPRNLYVQEVVLNGQKLAGPRVAHAALAAGGKLTFQMGPQPAAAADAPLGEPVPRLTDVARPGPGWLPEAAEAALLDDDSSTAWRTKTPAATLQFAVDPARPVTFYSLTSAVGAASADPHSWALEGSQDGKAWQQLDARQNESFIWRQQQRPFKVQRPGTYPLLRLRLQTAAAPLSLAEVELLAEEF